MAVTKSDEDDALEEDERVMEVDEDLLISIFDFIND